jgi:hypothetical protein
MTISNQCGVSMSKKCRQYGGEEENAPAQLNESISSWRRGVINIMAILAW